MPQPTETKPGIFSDINVEVPTTQKEPRIGQTDTEIMQAGMQGMNPFSPLSIANSLTNMAVAKSKQIENTPKIMNAVNKGVVDLVQNQSNTTNRVLDNSAKSVQSATNVAAQTNIPSTPIKSAEDRIKEIEARLASQTSQQRTASLLASSEASGRSTQTSLEQGKNLQQSNAAYMAKRAGSGTVGDVDTALKMAQLARQQGVYVTPEIKKAKSERTIIPVTQGDQPTRLQDLSTGVPKLMTGAEVAAAGDRLTAQINRTKEAAQAIRNRTATPSLSAQAAKNRIAGRNITITPSFRESVEYYKGILKEST